MQMYAGLASIALSPLAHFVCLSQKRLKLCSPFSVAKLKCFRFQGSFWCTVSDGVTPHALSFACFLPRCSLHAAKLEDVWLLSFQCEESSMPDTNQEDLKLKRSTW